MRRRILVCLSALTLWSLCATGCLSSCGDDGVSSSEVSDAGDTEVGASDSSDTLVIPDDGTTGEDAPTDLGDKPDVRFDPTYEPPPSRCSDPGDARCEADAATFGEWETAVAIDDLFLEGTDDDPVCCFDVGGRDEEIDNQLGQLFADFPSNDGGPAIDDLNADLERLIADGQTQVLELEGFDAANPGDEFVLNVYRATSGQNGWAIARVSLEEGVRSRYGFESARMEGGSLVASNGTFAFRTNYYGFPMEIIVREARIEADAAFDAGEVTLTFGRLGGSVSVLQLHQEFNAVAETCGCLDLAGEPLLSFAGDNCPSGASMSCDRDSEPECAAVERFCPIVAAAPFLADIDHDGDGVATRLSIGMTFQASPAVVDGVGP